MRIVAANCKPRTVGKTPARPGQTRGQTGCPLCPLRPKLCVFQYRRASTMPCQVGITTDPDRRRREWETRAPQPPQLAYREHPQHQGRRAGRRDPAGPGPGVQPRGRRLRPRSRQVVGLLVRLLTAWKNTKEEDPSEPGGFLLCKLGVRLAITSSPLFHITSPPAHILLLGTPTVRNRDPGSRQRPSVASVDHTVT